MKWIVNLYNRYPLAVIAGGFAVFFVVTVLIMKYKNRKDAIAKLQSTSPEAMDLSYLGQTNLPRGIRNNNPGNLIKTSISWMGKLTPSGDTRFEQFEKFVYGLRAKIRDLRGDIKNKGKNTLELLIYEYAPPFENNTESYINNVSQRTGFARKQILQGTKEELRLITKAMAISENGNPQSYIGRNEWFDDAMYNAAWDLSLT